MLRCVWGCVLEELVCEVAVCVWGVEGGGEVAGEGVGGAEGGVPGAFEVAVGEGEAEVFEAEEAVEVVA
jgi:hypothetical protein